MRRSGAPSSLPAQKRARFQTPFVALSSHSSPSRHQNTRVFTNELYSHIHTNHHSSLLDAVSRAFRCCLRYFCKNTDFLLLLLFGKLEPLLFVGIYFIRILNFGSILVLQVYHQKILAIIHQGLGRGGGYEISLPPFP